MLVDTSAWIEAFKYQLTPYRTIISDHITSGGLIYTCPIIVQEVLQGVLQKDYAKTKGALASCVLLSFDFQFQMAEDASTIYRRCRAKGITIRKANDCLIAHYAISYGLPLLHKDKDFNSIAQVHPLKIVKLP